MLPYTLEMNTFLAGIYVIWLRDIIRFGRDRARIVGAIAQPTLYLFVVGTGISAGFRLGAIQGQPIDYRTFLFPGIIGMSLLFTSIFSAMSIVWEREFGFLKEVMVAPIPRFAVALGKCAGGATVATMQGSLLLLYAPLVGLPMTASKLLMAIGVMLIMSMALSSLGVFIAANMKSMESFQMIMNFLMMPLFFLSGALFPVNRLPVWLSSLVAIDPANYGVDALRAVLTPGVNHNSLALNLAILIAFGLVVVTLAVLTFQRTE